MDEGHQREPWGCHYGYDSSNRWDLKMHKTLQIQWKIHLNKKQCNKSHLLQQILKVRMCWFRGSRVMVTLTQAFQGSGYKRSGRKKPFLCRRSKSSLVSKTAAKIPDRLLHAWLQVRGALRFFQRTLISLYIFSCHKCYSGVVELKGKQPKQRDVTDSFEQYVNG